MNKKTLLNLVLCVLILAIMLPTAVLAENAKKIVIKDSNGTVKSSTTIQLYIGDTYNFTAELTPSGSEEVIWNTSSSKVATVTNGKVTAISKGTVSISARSKSGSVSASVQVKVLGDKVSAIDVTPKNKEIVEGTSTQFKAAITPATAANRNVSWSVKCTDPVDCGGAHVSITSAGKISATHISKRTVVTVRATAVDGSKVYGETNITFLPKAISLNIIDKEKLLTVPIYGAENHYHTADLTNKIAPIIKDLSTTDKYVELEALIETADAMDVTQNVKWSSSNRKIADVDSAGIVTFYKAGTVTITAKTTDGSNLKATAKITARILPNDIVVTANSTTLAAGKSMQLKATVYPTNATSKNVKWYSLDPMHAATISSSGKVTALKVTEPITVTFVAEVKDVDWRNQPAVKGYYAVTIYPVTTSVKIQNSSSTDVTGKTVKFDKGESGTQLSAYTTPSSSSQDVSWSSSNKKIATVDQTGYVTFTGKTGTVTITAKAKDGSGKKATVKLQIIKQIQDITISVNKTEIRAGKQITLKATLTPSKPSSTALQWVVENTKAFAAIKGTALTVKPTAKAVTETICTDIYAVAKDGSGTTSNTVTVCVYPSVKKVAITDLSDTSMSPEYPDISKTTIKLNKGSSIEIGTDIGNRNYPDDANQNVTWSTANKKIASVSGTTITGVKVGTTTITAKATDGSGKTGTIKIQVVNSGGISSSLNKESTPEEITIPLLTKVQTENLISDEFVIADEETTNIEVSESVIETNDGVTEEMKSTAFSIIGPKEAVPGETMTLETTAVTSDESVFWFSSDEETAKVDNEGAVAISENAALEAVVTFTALLNDGNSTFAEHEIVIVAEKNPESDEAVSDESVSDEAVVDTPETSEDNVNSITNEGENVSEENNNEITEILETVDVEKLEKNNESTEPIMATDETNVPPEVDTSSETEETQTEDLVETPSEGNSESSAEAEEPEESSVVSVAPAIESIDVDVENDTVILFVGDQKTIESEKLTILPEEADWVTLNFEIENEYLAKLDSDEVENIRENGLKIIALAAGETKLTIKSGDVEKLIHIIVEEQPVVEESVVEETMFGESIVEEPVLEVIYATEEPATEENNDGEPVESFVEEPIAEVEAEAPIEEIQAEEPAVETSTEESDFEQAESEAE